MKDTLADMGIFIGNGRADEARTNWAAEGAAEVARVNARMPDEACARLREHYEGRKWRPISMAELHATVQRVAEEQIASIQAEQAAHVAAFVDEEDRTTPAEAAACLDDARRDLLAEMRRRYPDRTRAIAAQEGGR